MREEHFPIKTFEDIMTFKKNKKYEDIEKLLSYIDSQFGTLLKSKKDKLEYKYTCLIYNYVLIYKNIDKLKKSLSVLELNLAYETDFLIKDLSRCVYIYGEKYSINNKKLAKFFNKTVQLQKKVGFEIFSEKYSYLKDELLSIRKEVIESYNKKNIDFNNDYEKFNFFDDLQIANNLWKYFKNLNYAYYKDLNEKVYIKKNELIKYIQVEKEIINFQKEHLLKMKNNPSVIKQEKVYIDFFLLIDSRLFSIFYD